MTGDSSNGSSEQDDVPEPALHTKVTRFFNRKVLRRSTGVTLSSAQRAERTIRELYGKTFQRGVKQDGDDDRQ